MHVFFKDFQKSKGFMEPVEFILMKPLVMWSRFQEGVTKLEFIKDVLYNLKTLGARISRVSNFEIWKRLFIILQEIDH